ncbi:MAG: hypothetical protein ACREDK_06035 [Thermoplasmata archaeon]
MGSALYVAPPPAANHPHRSLGILLLVVGIILMVVGIGLAAYCGASFFGVCISYPDAGIGALSILIGIVLLIVGIVLAVMHGSMAPAVPVVYTAPQPFLPAVPAVMTPVPSAPSPAGSAAERYCASCGSGNTRVSAFCQKCGKPLPPPP